MLDRVVAGSPFRGEGSCEVPVAPGRLFRFVADGYFENVRRWDPGLLEITKTSDGPVGRGTSGRQARMDRGGFRTEQSLEVVEFERDRLFAVETVSAGLGALRFTYAFEPAGVGTRLVVGLEGEWPGGGHLLRSMMEQEIHRAPLLLARRIAALVEEPSANI